MIVTRNIKDDDMKGRMKKSISTHSGRISNSVVNSTSENDQMIFLKPDRVLNEVMERKFHLENCLNDLELRLKNSPKGSLRITSKGKFRQFYHRQAGKYKYIRKDNLPLAEELARKDYYLKLQKELKTQLDLLNVIVDQYKPSFINDIFEELNEDRRRMINPIFMTDSNYAEWWLSQDYPIKGFSDGAPEYYTDAGQRVRSKSEIIIADKLWKYSVPYRYEFPVILKNGIVLHPDFYCLNVRTREEFIWEHFGMMDDSDYAANAVKKLDEYSGQGYVAGKNLIATFETRENPLNIKMLETNIKMYLL